MVDVRVPKSTSCQVNYEFSTRKTPVLCYLCLLLAMLELEQFFSPKKNCMTRSKWQLWRSFKELYLYAVTGTATIDLIAQQGDTFHIFAKINMPRNSRPIINLQKLDVQQGLAVCFVTCLDELKSLLHWPLLQFLETKSRRSCYWHTTPALPP